jgi:divalent metal cation (Fe/Co/Zn/Cd) transporter
MGHLRMITLFNFFAKTFLFVGGVAFIVQMVLRFIVAQNESSMQQLNIIQLDAYALIVMGVLMILGLKMGQK